MNLQYKFQRYKKARCVYNGSPNQKGSVTLNHTYAATLEQDGTLVFWSLAAISNSSEIGADSTNDIAEASPPKVPLFVTINEPFREW